MSDILNDALEYIDQGFSVVPVRRSDKKPYLPWKEFQTRQPEPEEVEAWFEKWPGANIAIVTGSISGIWVVDADGPAGIKWINENLPKTGVYSHTGKGVHAFFSVPPGINIKNAVRMAPEVDIRGDGGYVVVSPSIHQNGHQYKWVYILNGWDDLTTLDPAGMLPKKTGNLNLNLTSVSVDLDTKALAEGVPEGNRDTYIYKEACRLRGKNLTVEEAWEIISGFAAKCDPPFPAAEAKKKLDQAWKYEPNPDAVGEVVVGENIEPEEVQRIDGGIPEHILKPGGVLQDVMNCIEENSAVSVPFFNLAGAIALVGNVAGMRVQTQTGLKTNMYITTVGYSGTGKNAPFAPISEALKRSDASQAKGDSEFASGPGLFRQFTIPGREIQLMLLDEFGMVLRGLKNPNSAMADVPRLLIKLFSSAISESKTYANGETVTIDWQHLSFLGASTPERFWESLSGGDTTDGFLARILIFESHHDALLPKMGMQFQNYDQIVAHINTIWNIDVETEKGNLNTKPIPKIILMRPDAEKVFDKWRLHYHEERNKHKGDQTGLYSIYGRVAEHAAKLALIHAVSKQRDQIRCIEKCSVQWACDLMDYHTKHITRQVRESISDSIPQKQKNDTIKCIRKLTEKTYYKGATLRDLQRSPVGRKIMKKDLVAIVETLLLSEEIGQRIDGKKTVYYVAKLNHGEKYEKI